ncbi:MAG: hypothetical protein JNM62_13450 [Flavobacteriales bacterium]|nr:hypothetical protein [Flavobacteriales bacterium]
MTSKRFIATAVRACAAKKPIDLGRDRADGAYPVNVTGGGRINTERSMIHQ